MEKEKLLNHIKQMPAWLISILLHGLFLLFLTTIIMINPTSEDEIEVVAQLNTLDSPIRELPIIDDGESGGAPSMNEAAKQDSAEADKAPMPSMPINIQAMLGSISNSTAALTSHNPAQTDPAFAVLAELSNTPQASRTVGRGHNPLLDGTSPGFKKVIGGIRARGLDVVFVIDATDSMKPYIKQAKKRSRDVIGVIDGILTTDGKKSRNIRFGIVLFKDYGDDFGVQATKILPLTEKYDQVYKFIDLISVSGGGDEPEPINEALDVACSMNKMKWRRSKKNVIVLITDAPVHPTGRKKALSEAKQFARQLNGQINVIDVGQDRDSPLADLVNIAQQGNGSVSMMSDDKQFWKALIVSVFGKRFEQDVHAIVDKYTKTRQPDNGHQSQ